MKESTQRKVIAAYMNLEKLDRLRSVLEDSTGESPRALVASAALLTAELLTAAVGKGTNLPLVHRVYEEVLGSMERSPAVAEVFSSVRFTDGTERMAAVQQAVTDLRVSLVTGSDDNECK